MGFPAVFGLIANIAALSGYDYYSHFVTPSADAIAAGFCGELLAVDELLLCRSLLATKVAL